MKTEKGITCETCNVKDMDHHQAMEHLGHDYKEPQHTPTPWKLANPRRVVGGEHQVEVIGVSLSGSTSKPYMTTANEVSFAVRHEADAAFIVRAVNAYEKDQEIKRELLAALKSSQKLIQMARQYFPKSIHNSDKFTLENSCAEIGTAIAKAEGK